MVKVKVQADALQCGGAGAGGDVVERRRGHRTRLAFHAAYSAACFLHKSLFGASDVVQLAQIGASQVPLRLPGTFQSQSSVERFPQGQRFARPLVQTIAEPPPGMETW